MNDFFQQAKNITPDLYEKFKQAVAIGKWPDGSLVTVEQRDILLQTLIVYEDKHMPAAEKIAAMEDQCKGDKKASSGDDSDDNNLQQVNIIE